MWRVVIIAVVVLVALAGGVVLVGAMQPRSHVAMRSIRLHQTPQSVWQAIVDIDQYASWRSDLTKVERLPDVDGRARWREYEGTDKITYEVVDSAAPSRWTTRIADPDLPFGGTWTYVITPVPGGSSILTITEHGDVSNPIYRFVSRFVIGHNATLDKYLNSLAKKFGETATIGNG
jgi:hypothetical protein